MGCGSSRPASGPDRVTEEERNIPVAKVTEKNYYKPQENPPADANQEKRRQQQPSTEEVRDLVQKNEPGPTGDQQPSQDGVPSTTDQQQPSQDGVPSTTDQQQPSQDGVPRTTDQQQPSQDGVPSTTDQQQPSQDGVPSITDQQQPSQDGVPSTTGDQQPSQDGVPSTTGDQQPSQDGVPSTTGDQQPSQDGVPSTTGDQQPSQDGVPSTTGDQQTSQDGVPSTTDQQKTATPQAAENKPKFDASALDDLRRQADELQRSILAKIEEQKAKLAGTLSSQLNAGKTIVDSMQYQGTQLTEALNFRVNIGKAMRGDLSVECPAEARVVRIFVSSTFTDTRHERNWLMERVYPKLKTFCQNNGYDFQVVDMRWGIRDEAQDDHMTTDICLKEVQLCKEQSTGPCFVSLMSHKYGYRDFPRSIPADEFDTLITGVKDEGSKEMLLRWFQLDENSVPPTYVLQPISSQLPDTKSDVPELKKDAWATWMDQNSRMHSALAHSAQVTLDPARHNAYVQSVSEAEVGKVVEDINNNDRLVWFRRIIKDIHQVDAQKEFNILRRYKDTSGESDKDEESQRLLAKLEEDTLTQSIPSTNLFNYEVNWQTNEGINPYSNPSHKEYLEKLCLDAEKRLMTLCHRAFIERAKIATKDPLFQEVLQHLSFCRSKCESFHGRAESLQQIEDYLRSPGQHPLTIYGPSGCGKTSLLAMAANLCNKIHGSKSFTIIRFIGTTPDSTTLSALLTSLYLQLLRATLTNPVKPKASTTRVLALQLFMLLGKVAKMRPVVLLLDSLDQFDPSHDARQLTWLPAKLPANVKLIVSTLPDAQYEAFPILQEKMKDVPESMLEVPELNESDITGILDQWLTTAGRKLTQEQRYSVLDTFDKCPLPLFLKLSFDEASKWKSFTRPELAILQPTIRDCINQLLMQMEVSHGKVFVSRALGYLTISESGLSEAELEDILSCDNEVLGDVYRFWTPPVRRLPPLLLIRVKRDLGHYVVNRGADGKQVFYWYHRQFIEAARERYCSDEQTKKDFHSGLADFFAGTWGDGNPKPFYDNQGREMSADRHVASQPLKLGEDFNTRKLSNLAHHRNLSGNLALLKSECLLNLNFLKAKIACFGVRSMLDDFQDARHVYPDDLALEGVGEALQLSQSALTYDVRLLETQLLGRIRSSRIRKLPEVSALLAECENSGELYLEPDRPVVEAAGGMLVHSIAEHTDSISALVVNRAGTVAVTCEEKGTVKTYDIQEGKVLKTITGVGKDADRLVLADNDSTLILNPKGKLSAYNLMTGTKKWSVDLPKNGSQFIVGGPSFSRVLLIRSRTLIFLDAGTGTQVGESSELPDTIPSGVKFESMSPAVGCEKYMVTVESDQKGVFVFDAVDLKLSHFRKVLKSYKDEKNDKVDATVDGLTISHDGNTLYMANMMDNDLYMVDTATLEIIKSFQGIKSDYSEKFHLSNDGCYIYFSNSSYVRVWDLSTGKKATVLNEPNVMNIEDVFTADMNTFITSNTDRTLKIWDLRRSDNPTMEFQDLGREHKSSIQKANLRDLIPLDSTGRYFLAERSDKETCVLAIFDTSSQTYVYQATWVFKDSDHRMSYIRPAGDWKISFEMNRRCRVLDLLTMKVSCVIQGQSPQYSSECFLVNGDKELATLSRGRMNIKLVDLQTGKILSIMKGGQTKRIDTIVTNKTGTKIVSDCEGPLLVFDVVKRSLEVTITPQMVKQKDDLYLSDAAISADGVYLFFSAEYKIPQDKLEKGVKNESVTSIYVFHIKNKCLAHILCDVEDYNKLGLGPATDQTVSADGLQLLDNTRLVSTHDDFVVRIWEFTTGQLIQRLTGHISYVRASVCPGSSILITNGNWDEEYTIRLWDTSSWNCIALYRYEFDISEVQLLGPNSSTLIGRLKSNIQPIMFTLKGPGSEKYRAQSANSASSSPAITLQGNVDLDLTHPNDETIDEDNPDSDPEEVDSDDDDDDDDDEEEEEEISDEEGWLQDKDK